MKKKRIIQYVNVEKPKCGKNHGSPETAENHYERKIQKNGEAQRQRPLVSFVRHTTVTMRQRPLTISLSLSLYTVTHPMHIHTTTQKKRFNQPLTLFALSHIYTHMTFGLFTHMTPRGPTRAHLHMCPLPISREDHRRALDHPVLLNFPSGGTCFPTNSPLTPAWDVG